MIKKLSSQPLRKELPQTSEEMLRQAQDRCTELKNQFELRGSRTVLGKKFSASYSQKTFAVADNLYGAKLNTSQLQEGQPNEQIKAAMRKLFLKNAQKVAAGTPSRARPVMNLFQ